MDNESVEVRIARIEEAVKSQGKGLQDIKDSLNQVTASLKEISKQMVEANTSVMGYFTSLSAKHQSIDEKIDRFTNDIHTLQKDKMDEKDFKNHKALKKQEDESKTDKIYKYIDKVESGLKTQMNNNSEVLKLIEKHQLEQKGGVKYMIGAAGLTATLLTILFTVLRITGIV